MSGQIQVIVGGQFGSEGKGHAAAELAKRAGRMLAIRTGGPNAGHTVWSQHREPVEYKLRQLPVAQIVNPQAEIAIAAGSLVDLEVLEHELNQTGAEMVLVDPSATILEPRHVETERYDPALAWGSTRKGIGAARADRIHRTAKVWGGSSMFNYRAVGWPVEQAVDDTLSAGRLVQIEAAQGYGLGLHTDYYPKTTSADCRAIDALADAGISPWAEYAHSPAELTVWIVIRPYPIRVAGDSGPLANETSWEELGLPVERTTVTNKVRRVGAWDGQLVRQAVLANGGPAPSVRLWLNMADHISPSLAGATHWDNDMPTEDRDRILDFLRMVQDQTGAPVKALGTGPNSAVFL